MGFKMSEEHRDWYATNAIQLSKHCLARGRYEIAEELHRMGTNWYEINVVGKRDPLDSPEDRKNYRELLKDYKRYIGEFAQLVDTRTRLIKYLVVMEGGVGRNQAKKQVVHRGVTAFGVICNQLDRGGWLRQQKRDKEEFLYPASSPLITDREFFEAELSTPRSTAWPVETAMPILSLNVDRRHKQWWKFWT